MSWVFWLEVSWCNAEGLGMLYVVWEGWVCKLNILDACVNYVVCRWGLLGVQIGHVGK